MVRIAIIGTGFGQQAQIPGFRVIEGGEVVAICSGRQERAEAVAREYDIPYAFSDYAEMLDRVRIDLVSIVTPVYLHHPMTMAALAKGCDVLCEKPLAFNMLEAREMWECATSAGVVHMIDHELRFNPTRMKIAQLLQDGYVGRVNTVHMQTVTGFRADPNRTWDWWSQKSRGGGALAAGASHLVDLLRWWVGEITMVSGQLHTFVKQRPDAQGRLQAVDVDDQCAFMAEFESGAHANVFISNVARYVTGNQIEIHGTEGGLVLDRHDRLWGMRTGQKQPAELTVPDPVAVMPGIAPNVWAQSFAHLARELVAAIQERRKPTRGATFYDGLRCQQVLDAVRRSWDERRWVEVEKI